MQPRFLLYKASAGSGKTFNLALQYIALLAIKGEQEFRHTLAVTFTNKATSEMKDRILKYLKELKNGENGKLKEALQKVLREEYHVTLTDEELRTRSQRSLKAILHDYSRFYVSTIDAFFQNILRNMARELGLNARLQVDLNEKEIVELAVDSLIEHLRHDNQDVLPWLRQYISEQLEKGEAWDVRRELKKTADMLFKEDYLKRSLDEKNLPFDLEHIKTFRKALTEEVEWWKAPIMQEAENFETILRRTGMDYEELCNRGSSVRKFVEGLKAGDMEVNFNSYLQEMANEPLKLLKAAHRKSPTLYPVAQELSQQLDRLSQMQKKAQRHIGSINLILNHLTPMGLFGAIEKEVSRLSNERNRFILARTPIMLKRMVGNDDSSFVFERIGTQYNNIMIDEFQDTSQLQWENFRTLLLDNLSSGGLSMVVGDIKQSIYRWRNGDWRILHDLDKKGYRGIPLIQHPLDDNYRSLGNIVTFNNRFFPLAAQALDMLSGEDCNQLSDLYGEVRQGIKNEKKKGYVRLQLCRTNKKEMEEAWPELMMADLCRQVTRLRQQGVPDHKMTILLRKNRYIQPIIQYFAAHMPDVQLVSNEAFLLGASVAVRIIICALQTVDDAKRDPIAVRYVAKHYLSDVLHLTPTANDYLLRPAEEILPEAFILHLDELSHLPLYELCETIYRLLDLHNIEKQDSYLFCFFDELGKYLRDNPADISTFLQYWEEQMKDIAIPGGEVEGIRIYTIHKSKGLAFHTVLMPYAEWTIEKDMNDLYWCTPQEAPLNEMGSLPVRFSSQKIQGTLFEEAYTEEHANRRADELNALYVAFTRAEANLFVWGLSKKGMVKGSNDETVADLMYDSIGQMEGISQTEDEENSTCTTFVFGKAPEPALSEDSETPGISMKMVSHEGALTFQQSGEANEFISRGSEEETDHQQLSYIEQGKLLHYIFSKIESDRDIDHVIDTFVKQGILKSGKQAAQVRALAQRGLHHERVQDWFSGRYQLFNECNILLPIEGEVKPRKCRPDRVMMDESRIIIVDFKFGKPNEEYHTQVARYMEALKAMYPEKKVEGWLWYVYKNKVEEVKR